MCTRLLSDATLTRLIRPTKAHNSLYLNRQNVKNYLWLVALLPLLSGCESQAILVKKDDAYFAPPKTEAPPPADGRAGGVFETGYNWSLTADRRAYRVGDILTVILEESTQSSKQAKTNFGKATPSISAHRPFLVTPKISFPALSTPTATLTAAPLPSSRTACAGRSPCPSTRCSPTASWKFAAKNG